MATPSVPSDAVPFLPQIDEQRVERMLSDMAALPPGTAAHRRLRQQVIEVALPLALRLASRYHRRGEPDDDLRQEAALGLVKAVDGYRHGIGRGFLSYAVPTILGTLRHHFRDRSWTVRPPRHVQEFTPRLASAEERLTHRLCRTPRATEVAGEAGIEAAEVVAILQAARSCRTMSMEDLAAAGCGFPDPTDAFATAEDLLMLGAGLAHLPARLQLVIRLRFWEERTQTEIGETLGVSQMHVSRLLTQAIQIIRRNLPDHACTRRP